MLRKIIFTLVVAALQFSGVPAWAAPKADLWPRWQANDPGSNIRVDHSAWAEFLENLWSRKTTGSTALPTAP